METVTEAQNLKSRERDVFHLLLLSINWVLMTFDKTIRASVKPIKASGRQRVLGPIRRRKTSEKRKRDDD